MIGRQGSGIPFLSRRLIEVCYHLVRKHCPHGGQMQRRNFIKVIFGSAVAWPPLATRAQQSAMPVIGFLRSTSLADSTQFVTTFRQGLKETGFVEGSNVAIELRFAEGRSDRLPELAGD
jgi:putative ABC transport system substrate-binding protein